MARRDDLDDFGHDAWSMRSLAEDREELETGSELLELAQRPRIHAARRTTPGHRAVSGPIQWVSLHPC
jgi:hypothetical protein